MSRERRRESLPRAQSILAYDLLHTQIGAIKAYAPREEAISQSEQSLTNEEENMIVATDVIDAIDGSADSKKFFRTLDSIPDIPTLPTIALKVNKMLKEEDVSISELSKIIENDQAMVTKILRLVNSSFYHFQSKIESIPRAIVVLGLKTIHNAVLSVSLIESFKGKDNHEEFDISEFWHHSIAVAVTSKHLGEKTLLELPDECFVAGLLHDIGKVVLAQYFRAPFSQILALIRDEHKSFDEAEKTVLPVSHAQIGGYLAQKWNLPSSLVHAIKSHHFATTLSLSMIVHVADIVVNTQKIDSRCELNYSTRPNDIMADQLETVAEWYPRVNNETELICDFMLRGGNHSR